MTTNNPLYNQPQQQIQTGNNSCSPFMSYVSSIKNPAALLNSNNPLLSSLTSVNDPKQMVYQLAKQKGVSESDIISLYNSLTPTSQKPSTGGNI